MKKIFLTLILVLITTVSSFAQLYVSFAKPIIDNKMPLMTDYELDIGFYTNVGMEFQLGFSNYEGYKDKTGFNSSAVDLGANFMVMIYGRDPRLLINVFVEGKTVGRTIYYYNDDRRVKFREDSDYFSYGVGLNAIIFRYFFVSYSIGNMNGTYTYDRSDTKGVENTDINSIYQRFGVGINIWFFD